MTKNKAQISKIGRWFSKRSAYFKNKLINSLLFFFSFLIISGVNFSLMFGRFLPVCFPLDLWVVLAFLSPIFFFKKTMFDRFYLVIVLVAFTVFYTLNVTYHEHYGVAFSLRDIIWGIWNAQQVEFHPTDVPWSLVIMNVAMGIVCCLGIFLFNCFWKFKYTKEELNKRSFRRIRLSLINTFSCIFLFEFTLQMWCVSERQKNVDTIDYVNYSPNYHFSHLGMFGYYTQEMREMVFDKGESVDHIKSYLNDASFLNDDFTNLFQKKGITAPTNIFIILIETGDQVMLNQYTTPNLYKLLNEGVNCNQNYSHNHTDVSDLISITGNYPQYILETEAPVSTPFSLPNILGDDYEKYFTTDISPSNDGYNTRAYMKTLNFDHCLYHEDILPEYEPWEYKWINYYPDSLFISRIISKILEGRTSANKPFYIQYPTIFMHQDSVITEKNKYIYDDLYERFGEKLINLAAEGKWVNPFDPESEDGKRFIRFTLKTMDFDEGLGNIMNFLYSPTSSDYFKNTILCVFGDHQWGEFCQNKRCFAQNIKHIYDMENIGQYSTILGFYNPTLNEEFGKVYPDHKVNKATWPSIITPTILDILGKQYNPKIYQSKSLFDPEYSDHEVLYSYNLSTYFNEHYSCSDSYNLTRIVDDDGTWADFMQRVALLREKMRIVDSIYKQNLFKYHNYEEFMPLN